MDHCHLDAVVPAIKAPNPIPNIIKIINHYIAKVKNFSMIDHIGDHMTILSFFKKYDILEISNEITIILK